MPNTSLQIGRMDQISQDIYSTLPYDIPEGSASPRQMAHLASLVAGRGFSHVGEIGFNTGHSASAFISADSAMRVTSFDIGSHDYVSEAKARVDDQYPRRHTLILGDSKQTLPEYSGEPFDALFIDGGHDFRTSLADINNGRRITREGGLVIVDDLVPYRRSGIGPSLAWVAAIESGVLRPESIHFEKPTPKTSKLGAKVMSFARMRGWGVASYR